MSECFPVGQPIHLKGKKNMDRLVLTGEGFMFRQDNGQLVAAEGVCQVIVSVPRDADVINDIPFLPYKHTEGKEWKTYRMTCKKCLIERREDLCPHSLEERSFRSTYCLCELFYAATLGYKILALEEAVIYVHQEPVFESFFKLCASMKIRHDTIPPAYQHQLERYCQEVNIGMNFTEDFEKLTPEKLVKNLSEKTSMKQLMNRIIGKLGQRPAHPEVKFLHDKDNVAKLFANPELEIQNAFKVNDKVWQVNYLKIEKYIQDSRKTNPVINSLITAKARIKLHRTMCQVQACGARVLYVDTDSILMIVPREVEQDLGISISNVIFGHWKDECPSGQYISQFFGLR